MTVWFFILDDEIGEIWKFLLEPEVAANMPDGHILYPQRF